MFIINFSPPYFIKNNLTNISYSQLARGESSLCYTSKLDFINDTFPERIPAYKVLDDASTISDTKVQPTELVKMYETMASLNVMDRILYESQRQGRISFYMTNHGEEAVQIGSASALRPEDLVYSQYRESGVLLWRGFEMTDFLNQCYGNEADKNKGRQMPVHYGSKDLNFVTISSPLTTQLPQAVGAAFGLKTLKKDVCVACYFGEGAASEGDAHAALNFAATLDCPVLFICRNNGYAISTPSSQQYGGDGIAAKGPAYGIKTLRVDGNDVLAVREATEFARSYAISENKPVLLEAMTYRIGHHSTSDDSTAYRSNQEIDQHSQVAALVRFRAYLEKSGLWDDDKEKNLLQSQKRRVFDAIAAAEKRKKPFWKDVFSDVYSETPENIKKQVAELNDHVAKYSTNYPLSDCATK